MPENIFPDNSRKKNPTGNGLKEGLMAIRNVIVAAFALLITLVELLRKAFSEWRIKAQQEAVQLAAKRKEDEKEKRQEERDAQEKSKIAEELRAEEREIRAEERKAKQKQKKDPKKFIYPFLAAISTTALIVGVARLSPIARWTRSQNDCIEKTSKGEALDPASFANKVMRCNGGHD